jgi:hypothetical protein
MSGTMSVRWSGPVQSIGCDSVTVTLPSAMRAVPVPLLSPDSDMSHGTVTHMLPSTTMLVVRRTPG